MATKCISSTKVQNNFGRVLDDVTQNHARYVVKRRGVAQAVILSVDDLASILGCEHESRQMTAILAKLRPEYRLGELLEPRRE